MMQAPRRPAAGAERGSGGADLPYDPAAWSRRLDEAREARAKILATREAEVARGGGPADARRPGWPPRQEEPLQQADASPRRAGRRLKLRVAAGFLFGMVLGAFVVVLLLPGGQDAGLAMVPERVADEARSAAGLPAGEPSHGAAERPPPDATESPPGTRGAAGVPVDAPTASLPPASRIEETRRR